jgi:uncharacterized protein (DUF2062 family)
MERRFVKILRHLNDWKHGNVHRRISAWLKQGISAETLALSIAFGFVLGVFPVLGLPTVLCGLASVLLRLNFPAVQLVNYLVYPLQIALLWPFAHFGDLLFGAVHFKQGWAAAAGLWALHTTAAWLCFAIPVGFVLYFAARPILAKRLAARISAE